MPGFNLGRRFDNCHIAAGYPGLAGALDPSQPTNTQETFRRHRFRVEVGLGPEGGTNNFLLTRALFHAEDVDRPVQRVITEKVWNGPTFTNVPLRGDYDPIQLVLYEIADEPLFSFAPNRPGIGKAVTLDSVLRWWTQSSFEFDQGRMTFSSGRNTTVRIQQLDSLGGVIWTYKLRRAWPEIVNPENLSYRDSEISKVSLTLRFDRLEQGKDIA